VDAHLLIGGPAQAPQHILEILTGLPQGDPGAYTLPADGIRQFGHDVPGDLRELWRRLVFSLLAGNYDDHLRNHPLNRVPLGTAYL
jgi:HipA-like C-terminal domain